MPQGNKHVGEIDRLSSEDITGKLNVFPYIFSSSTRDDLYDTRTPVTATVRRMVAGNQIFPLSQENYLGGG